MKRPVALASQEGLSTQVDAGVDEEVEDADMDALDSAEVKAQVLSPPPPPNAAKEAEDTLDEDGDSTPDVKTAPPKPAPHMAVSKLPQAPLQKRTFGANSPRKGEGTLL
jgi:hypothetical protein